MTRPLYYAGQPGEGYGWGVCNKYLIRELGLRCNLEVVNPSSANTYDGTVFTPVADHNLNPASVARGTRNLALCFFEFPLGPHAARNAQRYDVIFCGSKWCQERLAEIGVTHTEVLIQGVDFDIFHPEFGLRDDHELRLFSGGKFEYRKGQDIVLAAFRLLQGRYPAMRLVCSWRNKWPQLMGSMAASRYIEMPRGRWVGWDGFWEQLCAINRIDCGRVHFAAAMGQSEMARLMHSTDLGVFPNRCEGGTNLVLMEYLACGKTAIASYGTGHKDIYAGNFVALSGTETEMLWCEVCPEALAAAVEANAHTHFDNAATSSSVRQWTWARAARQILSHI